MTVDLAPGTGTQFTGFGSQLINATDQVAFVGFYGVSALNKQGIFVGGPGGTPTKIALLGDPAPGTSGTYGRFSIRGLTDSGDVVFFANVQDPGGFSYGAFFHGSSAGTVSLIVKQGDPAPGGGTFSGGLGTAFVNADGDVAFGLAPWPFWRGCRRVSHSAGSFGRLPGPPRRSPLTAIPCSAAPPGS